MYSKSLLITSGLMALLTASLAAEDNRARTTNLPPALAVLGLPDASVLSQREASSIRGQALDAAGIQEAAAAIRDLGQVQQFAGGISSFGGFFWGEGVLINTNTGSGAIFDLDNPEFGFIKLSNLTGNFIVERGDNGLINFVGVAP